MEQEPTREVPVQGQGPINGVVMVEGQNNEGVVMGQGSNMGHGHVYNGVKGQEQDHGGADCCGKVLHGLSIFLIIITFPFSLIWSIIIIREYQRAVIFRLGRIQSGGAKGPGLFFIVPCIDNSYTIDIRTVTFDVPPQEILSLDAVSVRVDAVVYYHVMDPVAAIVNVTNFDGAVRLLAATTLRNVLGTKDLSSILSDRESISTAMKLILDRETDPWGVKVELVEIKDVRLPTEMQRAMSAEAEAVREAKAKIIAADGELAASISLKKAAETMSAGKGALQLRYLQTLNTIAADKNSTIIFPLPMELMPK